MTVIHVYLPCSTEPDVKWKAWSDIFSVVRLIEGFLSFQYAGKGMNTLAILTKYQ